MPKRTRLSRKGSKARKTRMIPITDAEWQKLDEMYNYELPEYLSIRSRDRLVIRAAAYEGAPYKKVEITPKDVIEYYRTQAGNITSGIRTLAGFSGDWRGVDNMAKESLEIFKVLNRKALEREGKKYGMELK